MTHLSFNDLMAATGFILAVSLVFLYIGYWMGRNSAERPFNASEKPEEFEPGPTDEPEGDYIMDELRDYEGVSVRIPTIKENSE